MNPHLTERLFADFPALFRGRQLRFVGMENGRAVLGADVVPLPILLCRIVGFEKHVEQLVD